MKKYNLIWVVVLLFSIAFQSCDDFFDTDPKNIINEDDYIDKDDEMYKGFLGIFNKMQEAGDQAIFLTDTRCNVIEVTGNAPTALQNIYNYSNTEGNEYADPTCYYAVVIACNDYFHKMETYHKNIGGMSENSEINFKALLSSAIRIKVWAYYMLGRIYGQAYWFDDPLTELKDLSNTEVFTKCDMKMLADKNLELLENGIDIDGIHISSDIIMQWYTWLDEETQDKESNVKWQYLTPPRILLEAELRSWRCNYVSEDVAQADWLWIRDNLLKYMYDLHTAAEGTTLPIPGFDISSVDNTDYGRTSSIYQMNMYLSSGVRDEYYPYMLIFPVEQEVKNKMQFISGIMYDYTNHQRNRIVQYFCPSYPSIDAYYLRPSEYGKSLYNDLDIRSAKQRIVMNTINGQDCISKYYYYYDRNQKGYTYLRSNIFEIEPAITLFRGHDFHFLLAEAENHLGNWDQARTILNEGLLNRFANKVLPETWSYYYNSWLAPAPRGGYGNIGIVGAARGTIHQLPTPEDEGYNLTEEQRKEIYDWAIADEYLKEYVAEGKSYSYLCKIGERYANPAYRNGNQENARDSVAARIAPKYQAGGLQQKVKSTIETSGYWINWDLKD